MWTDIWLLGDAMRTVPFRMDPSTFFATVAALVVCALLWSAAPSLAMSTRADTATIRGTVTDKLTGEPLEGIDTFLKLKTESDIVEVAKTTTDADGAYEFDSLPAGEYIVLWIDYSAREYRAVYYDDVPWNSSYTFDGASLITLADGATATGIDASLLVMPSVSGRVVDSGGSPVADATVVLQREASGGQQYTATLTDPDGMWRTTLSEIGTYTVLFEPSPDDDDVAPEYYNNVPRSKPESATPLVVDTYGAAITGIDATLPAAAHLSGRVTHEGQGVPSTVIIWENTTAGWTARGNDWTDSLGHYAIGGLPAGEYCLEFSFYGDRYSSSDPIPLREFSGNAPSLELASPFTLEEGEVVGGMDAEVLLDPYRAAGTDRYATAVAASAATFPTGRTKTVVLTTGAGFADALCASALAGAVDGPILLVRNHEAPPSVLQEIKRLGATAAYIVGGTDVVDESVARAVDALPGMGTPKRLAGTTRYETSVEVAREVARLEGGSFCDEVFVARGDTFPDALSAGPYAYDRRMPVLLTRTDQLPAETAECLKSLGITSAIICGDEGAVSSHVETEIVAQLSGAATTTRRGGLTRYDTSASIAMLGVERGWMSRSYDGHQVPPTFGYATGLNFPDALSGASTLGARHGCLLLVNTNALPDPIAGFLASQRQPYTSYHPDTLVLGDVGVVSDWVMTQIHYALKPEYYPGPPPID